jgi:hypothetical protein
MVQKKLCNFFTYQEAASVDFFMRNWYSWAVVWDILGPQCDIQMQLNLASSKFPSLIKASTHEKQKVKISQASGTIFL